MSQLRRYAEVSHKLLPCKLPGALIYMTRPAGFIYQQKYQLVTK